MDQAVQPAPARRRIHYERRRPEDTVLFRRGDWAIHRDKGTVWIEAHRSRGVEIAIFLVRAIGDLSASLTAAGWSTTIVDAPLPDGRRLLVAAGPSTVPAEKLAELETARATAQAAIARNAKAVRNPRMVLLAGPNELGVRKFVEAAVLRLRQPLPAGELQRLAAMSRQHEIYRIYHRYVRRPGFPVAL